MLVPLGESWVANTSQQKAVLDHLTSLLNFACAGSGFFNLDFLVLDDLLALRAGAVFWTFCSFLFFRTLFLSNLDFFLPLHPGWVSSKSSFWINFGGFWGWLGFFFFLNAIVALEGVTGLLLWSYLRRQEYSQVRPTFLPWLRTEELVFDEVFVLRNKQSSTWLATVLSGRKSLQTGQAIKPVRFLSSTSIMHSYFAPRFGKSNSLLG